MIWFKINKDSNKEPEAHPKAKKMRIGCDYQAEIPSYEPKQGLDIAKMSQVWDKRLCSLEEVDSFISFLNKKFKLKSSDV